jgi:hypothetical protein
MSPLAETFALRAREFSDEVARLGQCHFMEGAFIGVMQEIERRRTVCDAASEEIKRHEDYVEAMRSLPEPRSRRQAATSGSN